MMRRLTACAFVCVAAIALAPPRHARAQTQAPPPAPLATLENVPAVIDFKDRAVYRGDVHLDYDRRAGLPAQGGVVTLDDHAHHRRGYTALPDGPGTFTTADGDTFYDADFEGGLAEGWGKLTIPSTASAEGRRFEGLFTDSAAYYGSLAYGDGASYVGYFSDGCYAGTPASPRSFPAPPSAGTPLGDDIASLPSPDPLGGTYRGTGVTVTATWSHTGTSCAGTRATNARVTYASGDAYLGDLSAGGRYVGYGAYFAKHDATHRDDVLLCGKRPDALAYGAGSYTIVSGRFVPDLTGGPKAVCDAAYGDVTEMIVTVPRDEDRLDGSADVAFANGDRATAPIVNGRLSGRGTYVPHAIAATIAGTFVAGRLGPIATLTDRCGHRYPMLVRDGVVTNDASRNGGTNYLFAACDRFVANAGGSVDTRGFPNGSGTKILTSGQTIAGTWRDGRIHGAMTVRVREPYVATIVVPDARQDRGRYEGSAIVRFSNGDVARGYLDGSTLEGPGAYVYASTHCTARGRFVRGKLRGAATLSCPNERSFVGVVGADGSIQ